MELVACCCAINKEFSAKNHEIECAEGGKRVSEKKKRERVVIICCARRAQAKFVGACNRSVSAALWCIGAHVRYFGRVRRESMRQKSIKTREREGASKRKRKGEVF